VESVDALPAIPSDFPAVSNIGEDEVRAPLPTIRETLVEICLTLGNFLIGFPKRQQFIETLFTQIYSMVLVKIECSSFASNTGL
jgi:hypothetical protein